MMAEFKSKNKCCVWFSVYVFYSIKSNGINHRSYIEIQLVDLVIYHIDTLNIVED